MINSNSSKTPEFRRSTELEFYKKGSALMGKAYFTYQMLRDQSADAVGNDDPAWSAPI
jgi:hypothetical protein